MTFDVVEPTEVLCKYLGARRAIGPSGALSQAYLA